MELFKDVEALTLGVLKGTAPGSGWVQEETSHIKEVTIPSPIPTTKSLHLDMILLPNLNYS